MSLVQQRNLTFAVMKKMTVLLGFLAMLLLAGCLKDEVGGIRVMSDSTVELYSVPHQVAMQLFHTGGPWTASCPASWVKVAKESGPGGRDTLTVITTEKNVTGSERTTQVTIESGGERITIPVRQRGDYALFDPKDFVMPAEGGVLDVTFRTNVPDSLMLYVSNHLASLLIDTRKDSANTSRAEEEAIGRLDWLRVRANASDSTRIGYFFLSINTKYGNRIDLDTLHFKQLPGIVPDSLPAVGVDSLPAQLRLR